MRLILFLNLTLLIKIRCSDARDEDGTVKIKIIEQKTGPLYKEDLISEVIINFCLVNQ